MVSMETDVSELLTLVVKTGIELDEQVAQLNNMGEVIRRGIEQAQSELRSESDDALLQDLQTAYMENVMSVRCRARRVRRARGAAGLPSLVDVTQTRQGMLGKWGKWRLNT